MRNRKIGLLIFCCSLVLLAAAQDLYTARGYWVEINKENYQQIVRKRLQGDSLSVNEAAYFTDYQAYLSTYYQRMSDVERQRYEEMKVRWDAEKNPPPAKSEEFQWRTRDRLRNGAYGFYYGLALASITDASDGATAGLPLIMAGLWQLGPIVMPKKYDNISYATIRAGNTGKILGLGYGAALALAVGPDNTTDQGKLLLGLSSLGSIALGEAAFWKQKSRPVSEGHIELMRHYGTMVPGVAFLGLAATDNSNRQAAGLTLLTGGIAGLAIGNSVAKRHAFTPGDVDAIGSTTWIATGVGMAIAGSAIEDGSTSKELLFIPAAAAIAGTIYGQHALKGLQLTRKQGSTINLASGGAALIGLGICAMASADKASVYFGVPSALALVTHQLILHNYKTKKLQEKVGASNKFRPHLAMQVMPENLFLARQLGDKLIFVGGTPVVNPVVKLRLSF